MFSDYVINGFSDEMRKIAYTGAWANELRGASLGTGVGMLGGALLNSVPKVYSNYKKEKKEGKGTAEALLSSGFKGLGHATKGMLVGGLAGAGMGTVAGSVAPNLVSGATNFMDKNRLLRGIINTGRQQIYGITGKAPVLEDTNPNKFNPNSGLDRQISSLTKKREEMRKGLRDTPGFFEKLIHGDGVLKSRLSKMKNVSKDISNIHNIKDNKLNTLPGLFEGIRDSPIDTAKTLLKDRYGTHWGSKRLMALAAPAAAVGMGYLTGSKHPITGTLINEAVGLPLSNLPSVPAGALGQFRNMTTSRLSEPKAPPNFVDTDDTNDPTVVRRFR